MAKKITKTKAKKAVKAAKRHPVVAIIIVAVLLVIVIAGVVLYLVKPNLYHEYLGVGKHTYTEWVKTEATCTSDGEIKRYCSVCGEEEIEVIPKLPGEGAHTYTEWTTTDATCGEDGKKERTCTACGEKETEIIPATGNHDYTETTTPATCGKAGKITRHCEVCGDEKTQTLPATGNHNFNPTTGVCTVCGYDPNVPEPVKASDVEIHFLELGNKYTGDCTLIKCGNTEVLIDAGSRTGSATTIKNYVDQYCTDGILEYVIATHAHQDHIAGFVGNSSGSTRTGILYQYEVGTLIQFAGTNATTDIYKNYRDAVDYAKTPKSPNSQGATVFTAKQCWYETDGAKKQYYLDEAETVSINILYQKYYDEKTSDENDYSVCILLKQEDANETHNYLFTGDLEASGESSLVDSNQLPEVDLFKGGHHGSYTASTDKLLKVIKPKNVAVCCCCGTTEYTSNVANTFPAQAFIDRVSKYTANIYCTTLITDYGKGQFESMNGNIKFYTENGELKLWCSNNTTILKETEWFKNNRTWTVV